MDLYILDDLFRRVQLIDDFESLIWTERWQSVGDFELEVPDTAANRLRFIILNPNGLTLGIPGSRRVMVMESVEYKEDDSGRMMMFIKGRSQEKILQDRVIKRDRAVDTHETNPDWFINKNPRIIVNDIFDHICRDGHLHPNDILPLQPSGSPSHYVIGDISDSPQIEHNQRPNILYDSIQDLCMRYNLGFRLLRHDRITNLYFQCYRGTDRTREGNVTPVVFDGRGENFHPLATFKSTQNLKNTVYTYFGWTSSSDVYGEYDAIRHHGAEQFGYNRRVLLLRDQMLVEDYDGPDFPGIGGFVNTMIWRAVKELNKPEYRETTIADGLVNQHSGYVYDVHYYIGDLVEVRNRLGELEPKRVTECTFVSDAQGDRINPTFTEPYVMEDDHS